MEGPQRTAAALAYEKTQALRERGLKFALDFQPHSHAYQLMAQIRSTSTGSGTVDLGNLIVCGFATTWGDGAFEVHRDFTADGSLARIRIEMATPQRLNSCDN